MANVSVYNIEGKEVGSIELNDAVFGVEVNEHLVHMAVVNQLANNRQGDTFRSFWWRKKTLETERNWSCKTGFYKISTVDRRWCCICTKAKRLFIQDE